MVIGIAKTPANERGQVEHLVRIALDALRYQLTRWMAAGGLRVGKKPCPDQLPA